MFWGFGIRRAKSLFGKLRKRAVRYGGVIVFVEEADSLGSRGGGVGVQGGGTYSPASQFESCHGFCYLSPDAQSALFAEALKASPAPRPAARFRQMIPGMGMGGGALCTLPAPLTEMSGPNKPTRVFNRSARPP